MESLYSLRLGSELDCKYGPDLELKLFFFFFSSKKKKKSMKKITKQKKWRAQEEKLTGSPGSKIPWKRKVTKTQVFFPKPRQWIQLGLIREFRQALQTEGGPKPAVRKSPHGDAKISTTFERIQWDAQSKTVSSSCFQRVREALLFMGENKKTRWNRYKIQVVYWGDSVIGTSKLG